ncbi:papain family cysteine protease domain-containing protein [Ditylenchus destructor]|nr:papain family cysteine protease domain-containing protein [Ditylenchus destructor]
MWEQEPETASLNTLPSGVSDTEVIISSSGNPSGGISILGAGNSAHTERVLLRNKLPGSFQASKLLKKSTGKCRRRTPLTMIQVVLFGLILLIVILCCIIGETWWSSNFPQTSEDDDDPFEFSLGKGHVTKSNPTPRKLGYVPHTADEKRYHEQMVQDVNTNSNAKWKATYNKFASRATDPQMVDKESLRLALTKNIETHEWSKSQMFADTEQQLRYLSSLRNLSLPKQFDSRQQWPDCESIHRVVNQGGCGSCWAMSATSVMSDRICIATNGTRQPHVSAQDLIECCPHCGGCRGTVWALFSFVHWKEHGVVTGSDYGSYEGCKPYEKVPNCGSPCSIETYSAKQPVLDVCWSVCHPLYDKTYQEDLNKAKKVYWVKPNLLNNVIYSKTMNQIDDLLKKSKVDYDVIIKRELMINGPMVACFVVHDEFQHYKSGIYESNTSPNTKELYGHCAKLIGWGEENGAEYWSYMNTWGRSWGENGFFRVAIKEIPEEAAAGIPLL